MSPMPPRFWTELAWPDFEAGDAASWIAVLPLTAVEQHGPHLPLGTDLIIMQHVIARLVQALPDDLPAIFLPPQPVGLSPEHEAFPGTLSLAVDSALSGWTAIGEGVARAGVRRLVLLNSHGGNSAVMDLVARELRRHFGLLVVTVSLSRFGVPGGLLPPEEVAHGVHAGAVETALMQAFRPDLVRSGELAEFAPKTFDMESRFTHLRAARPAGFGWMTQDLHPSGALGNATLASAEDGERIAAHLVRCTAELLADVAAFDPDDLADGPLD